MSKSHPSARRARRGMLTFEWILLLTLLVIGIVGGLSAARNALLHELGGLSQGVEALNASHSDEESDPGDHDRPLTPPEQRPWWETVGE